MQWILFVLAALCLAPAPGFAIAAHAAEPVAAEAKSPKELGADKGWSAYRAGARNSLVCYLVGRPEKSFPGGARHGTIDAHVTHRPGDKTFNVVNFDLGDDAKPGSSAQLDIDGKKFTLFTHQNSAWASDAAEDEAVTIALSKGKEATLKAVTVRGVSATDVYTLDGLAGALALIDKACGARR